MQQKTNLFTKFFNKSADDSQGFFAALKKGLQKSKEKLANFGFNIIGKQKLDASTLEEIEDILIASDVGVQTTQKIIAALAQSIGKEEKVIDVLKRVLLDILQNVQDKANYTENTNVILFVGVNGVGKTTTIAKLSYLLKNQDNKVMLAAGDTFRAAAIEQLKSWGTKLEIPVIAQQIGSDSASVIFDAFQSATAKNADFLIADTAGRLQNKDNLMNELAKIIKVIKKQDEQAPNEVFIVVDATTGQNAISQVENFMKVAPITGIILTKLDGSAKGGIVFALADKFNIPIKYVGVGEKMQDLLMCFWE